MGELQIYWKANIISKMKLYKQSVLAKVQTGIIMISIMLIQMLIRHSFMVMWSMLPTTVALKLLACFQVSQLQSIQQEIFLLINSTTMPN